MLEASDGIGGRVRRDEVHGFRLDRGFQVLLTSYPEAQESLDYGTMATIGRHRAVAACGPFKFSGYLAWFAWLLIHVMHLVEFRDRLFVFLEWAWSYITWNRGARLITGADRLPVGIDFVEATAGSEQAGRARD